VLWLRLCRVSGQGGVRATGRATRSASFTRPHPVTHMLACVWLGQHPSSFQRGPLWGLLVSSGGCRGRLLCGLVRKYVLERSCRLHRAQLGPCVLKSKNTYIVQKLGVWTTKGQGAGKAGAWHGR
jgi:hypothetical protein